MSTWILVAPVSMLLGHGVVTGRPTLGLQALAGVGGATLMVLYVFLEGPAGLAWGAVGLAIFGALNVSVGAYGLISAGGPVQTAAVQKTDEWSAAWAGLVLPLFMVVAVLSVATAVNGAASF